MQVAGVEPPLIMLGYADSSTWHLKTTLIIRRDVQGQ